MSTSLGVETLTETRAWGFISLIQSMCFLWSSIEYTEWNGNGEKSEVPLTASRILANTFRIFLAEKVPAEAGFGALGIFKFDDFYTLNRLFAAPPKRPVATWVITWSLYGWRLSGKPPSPVQVNVFPVGCIMCLAGHRRKADRAERHPAAVDRSRNYDIRPAVISAVERNLGGYF